MKPLSVTEWNAIYSLSRKAWSEIQEEWNQLNIGDTSNKKLVGEREEVSRTILREYEKKIKPRFTLSQLIYGVGVIRGVLVRK